MDLGCHAPGLGRVFRRHLRGRRKLAQRSRQPCEPRPAVRRVHAGVVRRPRYSTVLAGLVGSENPHPVHAGVGADLPGDGSDSHFRASIAGARRAAQSPPSRPVSQFAARSGGRHRVGHGVRHHILDGSGLRAAQRFGHLGRSRLHGSEHSRRRAYAIPRRPPVGSHGSAHGDRRHLHARRNRCRQHRRVSAECLMPYS